MCYFLVEFLFRLFLELAIFGKSAKFRVFTMYKRKRANTSTAIVPAKRRRFSRRKPTLNVLRPGSAGVIGDRCQAKLKWVHTNSLTSGVAWAYYQYNMASLYDPNYTGAGNQPAGFNEMMALYAIYHVNSVKIRLTFSAAGSTAASNHYHFGFAATSDNPVGSSPQELSLNNYGEIRQAYIDAAGQNIIKRYYSLSKILGVPPAEYYESDAYEGTSTTSPSKWPYFTVGVFNVDQTTATTCYYTLEMTFYCEFRRPESLVFS